MEAWCGWAHPSRGAGTWDPGPPPLHRLPPRRAGLAEAGGGGLAPEGVSCLGAERQLLDASREVYVEVVHDERRRLVLLRASPSKGGPYTGAGAGACGEASPWSKYRALRLLPPLGPNGLLGEPRSPERGEQNPRGVRWGEVVVEVTKPPLEASKVRLFPSLPSRSEGSACFWLGGASLR